MAEDLTMPTSSIVFVIGAPRSGTTLLRLMLAGHSRLFSPPELVIAPYETMSERKRELEQRYWEKGGLRRTFMELEGLDVEAAKTRVDALSESSVPDVYALLQQLAAPRILVDKCPHLAGVPAALPRLARWFPDARYLWIVRHPGSVIRSMQSVNMAESLRMTYGDPETVWRAGNQLLRGFLATLPAERWTRVSYEELVRAPEAAMRQVCRTLELELEPAMLAPYEGARMRTGPKGARATGDPNTAVRTRIEPELAESWLAGFDHRTVSSDTKALARELGYDLEALPLPPHAEVSTAFGDLLDAVRTVERGIELPLALDALEGRRFLLRLLGAAIETYTEHADVDRPRWHRFIGPTRKLFGDCPDCEYRRAPIQPGPGRVYKLSGRLPAASYVGFSLLGKGGRLAAKVHSGELAVDAEGRFELAIASEPQPGQQLKLDGDETELVVRQYFADRAREPEAELSLELVGPRPPPAPLDAASYAVGLQRATRMVKGVYARIKGAYDLVTRLPAKTFIAMPGDGLFATPDNLYQVCWYRFGLDQAFVVRGRVPKATYFSICLYNAWLESHDYTTRTISLNHEQLRAGPDGNFTIVLADRDPGVPNWLDTGGHHAGYVLARSLLLDGAAPELSTDTVWLHEL
jgi:hypothetical protein